MSTSLKKIVFQLMETNPNFTDQDLFNEIAKYKIKTTLNTLATVETYKTAFKKLALYNSKKYNK